MPLFASDTFTDADNTPLTSHVGEKVPAWAGVTALSNASPIILANRVASGTALADNMYYASGVASTVNYTVSANLVFKSSLGNSAGLVARANTSSGDCYLFAFVPGSNLWCIFKHSGSFSQVGTSTTQALTVNQSYAMSIDVADVITSGVTSTVVTCKVDGTTVATYTDASPITTVGKAGLWFSGGPGTLTTGIHFDNFSATTASINAPRLVQLVDIGDSITVGEGLSAGQDPPAQSKNALQALGYSATVLNQGQIGSATADWLIAGTYLPAAKAAAVTAFGTPNRDTNPVYAYIRLGANDAAAHVTAAAYGANLVVIRDSLLSAGYFVVFAYPTFIPPGANSGATDQAASDLTKTYLPQIDQLANGSTCFVGAVGGYDFTADHIDTVTQDDRTHPNAVGAAGLGVLDANAIDRVVSPSTSGLFWPTFGRYRL